VIVSILKYTTKKENLFSLFEDTQMSMGEKEVGHGSIFRSLFLFFLKYLVTSLVNYYNIKKI